MATVRLLSLPADQMAMVPPLSPLAFQRVMVPLPLLAGQRATVWRQMQPMQRGWPVLRLLLRLPWQMDWLLLFR